MNPQIYIPIFFTLFTVFCFLVSFMWSEPTITGSQCSLTSWQHFLITLFASVFATLCIAFATEMTIAAIEAYKSIHISFQ